MFIGGGRTQAVKTSFLLSDCDRASDIARNGEHGVSTGLFTLSDFQHQNKSDIVVANANTITQCG